MSFTGYCKIQTQRTNQGGDMISPPKFFDIDNYLLLCNADGINI